MTHSSTILTFVAMLLLIALAPLGTVSAESPPQSENGDMTIHVPYCSRGYERFDAKATQCNPEMLRDLATEGLTLSDIFEAWSCHGGSNLPGVTGCASWSHATPGFIVIRNKEVTYREATGIHAKIGTNTSGLGNGIYYCCYSRRAQSSLSGKSHKPAKHPPTSLKAGE